MNNQTYHKYLFVFGCVLASLFTLLSVSIKVQAAEKEIIITPENCEGGAAIQEALDLQSQEKTSYEHLTIVLQSGVYEIMESLTVYENTTIRAASDSVICYLRDKVSDHQGRAPLISNECAGAGEYSGAGNITIQGGIWDFQGHSGGIGYGITMEAFRFMHGRNFRIVDVTMQNIYRSHFLTLEGVEQVEVSGCVFQNYTDPACKKEAIHIDCMHNEAMAPSNQENTVYDDTICNQITVSNCTFAHVPRGIGSHIAVAGLFPSGISIENNTFTDITYEAIKAYQYKNVRIAGNSIARAGCGIKCYLYAGAGEKEEDGTSNYQMALPGVPTGDRAPDLNVVIQGNVLQDITDSKIGFGIHLVGNAERIVKNVTISNNVINASQKTATMRSGIYVNYGQNIRITDNAVRLAGGAGILVNHASTITISKNQVNQSASNGIAAQDSKGITISLNTVWNTIKRGIYLKATADSRIAANTVKSDKTGGIGVTKASVRTRVVSNSLIFSGKNAVTVYESGQVLVYNNQITNAKSFGIYMYKSDAGKIKKNKVKGTKVTAIIASNSTGVKVEKNEIDKTGKYGILFTSAKKCYATKNTISRTRRYGIIFSANSKNKKQNLNYPHVSAKKGEKEIHGYTYKKMRVTITISKKKKSARTKKDGRFLFKVKKLKKKQKYIIQVKDKLGNILIKEKTVTENKKKKSK